MTSSPIPHGHLPLRVNQLDAAASDEYIHEIILERLRDVLKYLRISDIFTSYQHEIDACIRLALWQVVFQKHHSSLGQQMLDLKYTSVRRGHSKLGNISRSQSILYLLCNIVIPYISARMRDSQLSRSFTTSHPHVNKLFAIIDMSWQYLNLINFVKFLLNGRFLHVCERICGIQTYHPKGRQLREVGFEFSNREIIWHGFTEFMVFLMPYINMRKVKSLFTWHSGGPTNSSKFCKVCDSYPTNPSQISDCTHIYCYHCAASRVVGEGYLECKECQRKITCTDSISRAQHRVDNYS